MNPILSISEVDQVSVAVLEGEIDLSCTPVLARRIFQQMSSHSVGLVLDMAGVRYIDSSGVRMLFDIARQLADGRRYLALSAPVESPLRRLFEVTHVADAAPLTESIATAVGTIRKLATEVADT